MTINKDKAHEVDHGVVVNEPNSGNTIEGPFYTGGPSSPIGMNLPENSFYVQNLSSGITIWQKFGNGVNDWEVYPASKIGFDPTNTDITPTNVQEAIESQANRHNGKDYVDDLTEFDDSTTGNSFKTYSSFSLNVSDISNINSYRIQSNFFWGHNSASNDIRVRLRIDGSDIYEIRKEPKDQGGDQRIDGYISGRGVNLSEGLHTIELQYRPESSARVSSMYRAYTEAWRTK